MGICGYHVFSASFSLRSRCMFSSLFDPLLQYPPIVLMLAYIPTTGLWRDLDLTSTTNSGLRL